MTTETVKPECRQIDLFNARLLHAELVARSGRGWNKPGVAEAAEAWVAARGPAKTVQGLNAGPWWLSWWAFPELEYRTLLMNSVPPRDYYGEFTRPEPDVRVWDSNFQLRGFLCEGLTVNVTDTEPSESDNDDEPAAQQVRKLPEEWAAEQGLHILDPDGWRSARRDFREPVTKAEFDQLLPTCTVGPLDALAWKAAA